MVRVLVGSVKKSFCSVAVDASYLNHGSGNTGLAAVGTDAVLLGLGNDAVGVLGLRGVEAGQVGAGLDLDGDLLGGESVGGRGAEGKVGKNLGNLHFDGLL